MRIILYGIFAVFLLVILYAHYSYTPEFELADELYIEGEYVETYQTAVLSKNFTLSLTPQALEYAEVAADSLTKTQKHIYVVDGTQLVRYTMNGESSLWIEEEVSMDPQQIRQALFSYIQNRTSFLPFDKSNVVVINSQTSNTSRGDIFIDNYVAEAQILENSATISFTLTIEERPISIRVET